MNQSIDLIDLDLTSNQVFVLSKQKRVDLSSDNNMSLAIFKSSKTTKKDLDSLNKTHDRDVAMLVWKWDKSRP